MRANVKPLTHWAIYRRYKLRYTSRAPSQVTGVLTTPAGEVIFTYDAHSYTIYLPSEHIIINEYGWEIESTTNATNPSPETSHSSKGQP